MRSEDRLGIGLDACDHVGADQRRRNAGGVKLSGLVGQEVGEHLRGGRPIPDDVVAAAPYGGVVVTARYRIGQQLLALRQAECIEFENLFPHVARYLLLVEHSAPSHIAGVNGLHLRRILRADRGADAVGADQKAGAFPRAVGEDRRGAVGVQLDAAQRFAEPVILRRQGVAKRAIKPRPAAHGARRRLFDDDLAAAVEAHDLGHANAHGLVERDAGALEDCDQLRVCAKADAAAGQLLLVALEHDRVPAGRPQHVRNDQPAQRAADHQHAAGRHPLLPSPLWGGAGVGVAR